MVKSFKTRALFLVIVTLLCACFAIALPIAAESGTDFIYGDANGDEATNGMDVLLLRKYMANYDYETGISTVTVGKGADANGDGTVSAVDVLLLRKYMANYNYDTGSSTVVLGPQNTQPPVTSESPVTTVPVTTEPPITTEAPVTTAPPVTTEPTVETVMADASDVALGHLSWQAAINGCASYDEKEEQITFVYNGVSYTFSDLKPAQIDVYSYDRIKRIIALEKNIEEFFDAETLNGFTVDVSDDKEELQIALTSIVDYCTDMISEFYNIMAPVHSSIDSVKSQYPLLSSTRRHSYNKWKSGSSVTGETVLEYAMYGRLTGSHAEEYELIRDAVYAVLNTSTYKNKSLVGYGTSVGTTADGIKLWSTSYQGAVYSVDPLEYAIRNESYEITGFDSESYKSALNTAINTVYTKFLESYVKDAAMSSDFSAIMAGITRTMLNYGIWTVEGEFDIGGEIYTYEVASTGKAAYLAVYDSVGNKLNDANSIEFEYDNIIYNVTFSFSADYENGKLVIIPSLDMPIPADCKDVFDLLGLKAKDLTYDIRDYADEIGANFDRIGVVQALGQSANYQSFTAEELNTIFNYEKQNDFYSTFELLRDKMYRKSTSSSNWMGLGTYVVADVYAGNSNVQTAITTLSKLARDRVYAMTAEANTVEDIEREFNSYATQVKVVLAENGLTYAVSYDAYGYETLIRGEAYPSAIAPTSDFIESMAPLMADASNLALEYISWQAAINGCAIYDKEDEEVLFCYNGSYYIFSDLKPAPIDIYSYDRIKKAIMFLDLLGEAFDVEEVMTLEMLLGLKVALPDDDGELEVAFTNVIGFCADMICEFHSIAAPVQSALSTVQDRYPLLGANKRNNDWKTSSQVTGEMVFEYAMYGRLTGSHAEEYKLIIDAVYAVLNTSTYKNKSLIGYGTSVGTTESNIQLWPNSYQGAIYSVDPLNYATRNANGTIRGFDSAAYKAALDAAINSVYTKFLAAYVKDVTQASDFDTIINSLTTTFYNYGIWNVEGEIVIDDETYTYAIASDGKTSDLVVYDSYDEKVSAANPIIFKYDYDNVEYIVDLTVVKDFVNGKLAITPAVSPAIPVAKDVYDFLGLKVEDLTYDIRDYADEIGANFAKIGTVKALGDIANYRTTNATELQTIFNYEKQNDFYSTFKTLCARMYNKVSATSVNWGSFGSYIYGWDGTRNVNSIRTNIVDADTFDAILVLSKLARDKVYAMTAENNTVEEIENEFHKFTVMVKAVLIENGYTFETSETSDGYEVITTIMAGASAVPAASISIGTTAITDVILEYIAWQAAINPSMYDEADELITFNYRGINYTFSDLKPAYIDVYSYESIKNIIYRLEKLGNLFERGTGIDAHALHAMTASVPDDDGELEIALTSVIDYCLDMISEFYSIISPVHSALASVQDQYPLLNVNKRNNDWKTSYQVTGETVLEYAMYGRLTGSHAEEYKLIIDAVYAVLNTSTYKNKSLIGYGTSVGMTSNGITLWTNSYQGAVYSVDPLKYAVRNADDKITGFDSAAYKTALNTAINSVYAKFVTEYVKDVDKSTAFDTIVTKLTTAFYNAGIWNVEDEIVIGDETYTYAIVSDGMAASLVVYDSSDEKITSANPIKFKYDNKEYTVTLTATPDFINGKLAIVPSVDAAIPAAKKDVYDLLGVKAEDLVYDIRNYTEAIGANFEKIGTFKPLGDSSNYRNTTKAELDTIFGYEVKNDFYATFEYLRDKMYTKSASSTNWVGLGTYIDSGVATGAASAAIETLSRMARDEVFAMTADANSIKDIEKAFNNFATRVKAVLAENGITEYDATNNPTGTYKVEKDDKGYEKLVPVTP